MFKTRNDTLRQKDDRIEELEEALRESVQITAEREMVLAQEEAARNNSEKQVEELMAAMEKVKRELELMNAKLSSTQQSLAEKEAHLTNLHAERRKHLEEVLEMKKTNSLMFVDTLPAEKKIAKETNLILKLCLGYDVMKIKFTNHFKG
ncbi:hypothetical protein scyTo_0005690 [Scyliorhinus torazame]|uniref:Uncharacterized protein n=1 Tax=Scyliorhinus torazame TaxID=75743 RepID=A0A401PBI8_SCYTO|nr:hypothetical protein [Scyliorhinus torazame]